MRAAVAASTRIKRRVSTSFPSKRKLLIITVPTGNTHVPVSAVPWGTHIGEMHSASCAGVALGEQSLTWIFPPAGRTNARDLAAPSDHSGLLTS